ncbi:MAG: hypothetical protein K8J08_16455, partial [Thermoanaerobaculia bacterium]|nr:hypothetical protein [Thermoanaerobaculia bacterium]
MNHLRWQILADDEWHAVRTALSRGYEDLLTSFSVAASPPLPLMYRALYDTVGLSEKILRFPMLLFGLLAILAFPWVLPRSRALPRGTRLLFSVLIAVSPILVYYSRYARPYSISVLFTFVGVMAFYRWWVEGRRRWWWIYLVSAVLAPYFHLTGITTLLAPLPLAGLDWMRRKRSGDRSVGDTPSLKALLLLGACCGVGLFAVLGAPLILDWNGLVHRAGTSTVGGLTLLFTLPLLAGSGRWWLVVFLSAFAFLGGFRIARRDPMLAMYLLGVAGATVVPSVLSKAAAIHVPIVFVRYNLWLVPLFLLLLADGLTVLLEPLDRPVLRWTAPLLVGLALFFLGPLPSLVTRIDSWTSHAINQYTYTDSPFSYAPARRPLRVSDFYHQLSRQAPGSLILAEAPWYYEWHNNQLPYYQAVHQQWVKAGSLGSLCRQPRDNVPPPANKLHLRNAVDISIPEALGLHGIDYVVLHKDTRSELPPFTGSVRYVTPSDLPDAGVATECLEALRDLLGVPVFEDRDLVVFDVERVKT